MGKKRIITAGERAHAGLHTVVGWRRKKHFVESFVRPQAIGNGPEIASRQTARQEAREAAALGWAEATPGGAADEKLA